MNAATLENSDQSADIAAAAAALRSDRFRIEREGDWARLEAIVELMEKGKDRKVSDEDAMAFPTLYRKLVSSLSIARESSLDASLVAYLEGLALRSYYLVYGTRTGFGEWCRTFFGGELSRSVRAIGFDLLLALVFMVVGGLVGYFLVAQNPDWYYALVPSSMGDVRVPGASAEALRGTLFSSATDDKDSLSVFATYLFSNNAQVSIMAFAVGFAFGVPTMLLLVYNMASLGAMLWVFGSRGLASEFVGWLSIHGTTELLAILLAGGAGIHVGRALGFPGKRGLLAVMKDAGQRGAKVMAGVIIMLICAGLLEGFARQLINDTVTRYIIGYSILLFWLLYFFVLKRKSA